MYPAARDDAHPVFSGFETFDVVGPMTRSVADAVLVLDVIAGHDPRDRHSVPRVPGGFGIDDASLDLGGLRVGWSLDLGARVPVDAEVAHAVVVAAQRFANLGARVEPIDLDLGDTRPTFAPLAALELRALRRWAGQHQDAVNERVRRLLGEAWTFEQVSVASAGRRQLHETVARLFERIDLLLTPTTPVAAYPVTQDLPTLADGRPMARAYDLSVFTAPFTLTGHPAASVPCGWTSTGLPIGMQLVAGHRADGLVLRAAAAIESAAPWRGSELPPVPAG
jgi:aspartyl-tRNA(Asn)/glutamyl-tRNA(Gln) amidotransferase subunit A